MITDLKRKEGEANQKEWLPVIRDILIKLLAHLNIKLKAHAIVHAAYCLAFAAFLRVSKFTYSAKDL